MIRSNWIKLLSACAYLILRKHSFVYKYSSKMTFSSHLARYSQNLFSKIGMAKKTSLLRAFSKTCYLKTSTSFFRKLFMVGGDGCTALNMVVINLLRKTIARTPSWDYNAFLTYLAWWRHGKSSYRERIQSQRYNGLPYVGSLVPWCRGVHSAFLAWYIENMGWLKGKKFALARNLK